jgi:hypothetical protein
VPPPQCHGGELAQPTAGAEGERSRQPGHARDQPAGERYAERRRRSRTSSTTIGINESRMTIPTTR